MDDAGVFTDEAGPFAGMDAMTDGSKKVVDVLRDAGVLLKVLFVFASIWQWHGRAYTLSHEV